MRVYTINVCVKRNNLDDISHQGYFVGYAATTGVITHWNPDQAFVIHIAHHILFNEYNSCLSIEDNHTPGYLLLQQDPEIILHYSDPLNLIPCELNITPTTFRDTKIITYEIELPPSGKKIGFNLLDDEYFIIPYITDTIPNFQPVINLQHRLHVICG